jgi:hypothetical protein
MEIQRSSYQFEWFASVLQKLLFLLYQRSSCCGAFASIPAAFLLSYKWVKLFLKMYRSSTCESSSFLSWLWFEQMWVTPYHFGVFYGFFYSKFHELTRSYTNLLLFFWMHILGCNIIRLVLFSINNLILFGLGFLLDWGVQSRFFN